MERAGLRYKNLASRCRQTAAASSTASEREALLRMAAAYDRRAMDLKTDFIARPRNRPSLNEDLTGR